MNTAFEVLVVILSVTLFIYLLLSIVVLTLVIKLVASLRMVVAKGEHLVDTAGEITETIRKNAGAVGLVKLLMSFINKK